MLLDQAHFDSLSPKSGDRVHVLCDTCGNDRWAIKQNVVQAKNHDCQKCASSKTGRSHKGRKHGEEHRRKTGLASRGRAKTEDGKRRLAAAHTGPKNNRWNPDREAVLRNEQARRAAYTILYRVLRRCGRSKVARTEIELGYSAAELGAHIEAQFEPGMSWANRSAWHIDHIKPVSAFVREGVSDPAIINALSNLRPMWAEENMSKRDRLAA